VKLRAAWVAGLLACGALMACSHDDDANAVPKVRTLGNHLPPAPAPGQAPAAATVDNDTPAAPPSPHVAFGTTEAPPITYQVKVKEDAAPKAVDPDVATVEAARDAASQCFTNVSHGSMSRFATIHVVVLPSGSVSRTEVNAPGTDEAWILSCLQGVGEGLHFADKPKADIRDFSIGVSVSRTH
jgi:hypothetical protein